jgi:hypothetical protein
MAPEATRRRHAKPSVRRGNEPLGEFPQRNGALRHLRRLLNFPGNDYRSVKTMQRGRHTEAAAEKEDTYV